MKRNTMVLLALPVIISSLMISSANAGNGRLSAGAELASPLGDFADVANTGYGGSVRYELPVSNSNGITLTVGSITFSGKGPYDGVTLAQLPILAGLKVYFKENQAGLYFHLLAGMCVTVSDAIGSETRTSFSWAPEMGYHFAHVDIGFRYQLISTKNIYSTKLIGLRLAYVLGSK